MHDFFQRHVLPHLGLKVFSLALSVALWAVLTREPVAEVAIDAPIEFQHMPDNLEIDSEHIPTAQVRVRGPERLITRLRPAEIHVQVDLAGAKPGERTFDLSAQQVREPRDLEIVQVVPSQLQLSFDARETRTIEVRPRVTGKFASGLRIGQVLATPAVITVSGPHSRVVSIDAASTDPIDASGVTSSQTFSTHVYIPDPLIQVVHPAPIHVTVIMTKVAGMSGGD